MSKSDLLRVTLVQTALHWEKKEDNLKHFDQLLASVNDTDLIVLPEMFSTGFSMRPELFAESMEGSTVLWMEKIAAEKNTCVIGSIIIKEENKFYNRLVWVYPNGDIYTYDKRHLFSMGNEHQHYTAGQDRPRVMLKEWVVCPLICYDLRFPVWSRNTEPIYDLLIYVANWPDVRRHAWKTLLTARAIENQAYVMGVNRIGKDANDIEHAGDSCVIDAKGTWISETKPYKESVETLTINLKELKEFREKFPVLNDSSFK